MRSGAARSWPALPLSTPWAATNLLMGIRQRDRRLVRSQAALAVALVSAVLSPQSRAVTADDVATVQRFAKLRKIDYPLLSDTNRDVINAFGLFNDRFPEGSRYRGTAIPMVVVVNAEGVVTRT